MLSSVMNTLPHSIPPKNNRRGRLLSNRLFHLLNKLIKPVVGLVKIPNGAQLNGVRRLGRSLKIRKYNNGGIRNTRVTLEHPQYLKPIFFWQNEVKKNEV